MVQKAEECQSVNPVGFEIIGNSLNGRPGHITMRKISFSEIECQ